jgi:single-strand DNA-binding protein
MTAEKPPKRHEVESCNEVTLVGRVSAAPEHRELPSGDQLVTLRVVVDRPPPSPPKKAPRGTPNVVPKRSVDVIDVACWTKRVQRTATGLEADDTVRVEGSLRRRFFAAGGGRASRYEVEATRLVRLSRAQR